MIKRQLAAVAQVVLRYNYTDRLIFKVVWVGLSVVAASTAATLGQSLSTDLWVGSLVAVVLVVGMTTLRRIVTIRTIGPSWVRTQELSRSTWAANLWAAPAVVGLLLAVKHGVTVPELVLILAGIVVYGEAVHGVAYLTKAKWVVAQHQAETSRLAAVEHYMQGQRRTTAN